MYSYLKACQYITVNSDGSYKNNCHKNNCTYAHSISQLRGMPCKYGDDCFMNDCNFQHPSEDIYEYYTRRQKTLPNIPKDEIKKTTKND